MDDELDRFKRVDLCAYAASRGYRLVRRETTRSGGSRGSTASSLPMRHLVTEDKVVVRLDLDGHWTYFSIRDDCDNGTIIDFVLRRGASTMAHVREELLGWAGDLRVIAAVVPVRLSATRPHRDRRMVRPTYGRARVLSNHPYPAAIGRLPCGSMVVIATDNDLAGDKLAERIARLAGETPTFRQRAPLGKDWNECLQRHERDYIRSLGLRGQCRSR